MPKICTPMSKLTALSVKSAKAKERSYKVFDGGGLFLLIHSNGSKYWRYRYRHGGKEKTLSLGVYPAVSLKEAREAHTEAKQAVQGGVDVSAERVSAKNAPAGDDFGSVANAWYVYHMSDKSESHKVRTFRLLDKYILPNLGSYPIAEIDARTVLDVLRAIEAAGYAETARKAQQTIGQVFRYAIIEGFTRSNPASELRGALKPVRAKHYAAVIEPDDVARLMASIHSYKASAPVVAALKIAPLLFARQIELRHMTWGEIDLNDRVWKLPGEKMKSGREHIVPLSTQAVQILDDLKFFTGKFDFVFPAARSTVNNPKPMSENAVRLALRALGFDSSEMSAHGFRAMARTMLDEQLGYPFDVIEHQLAHAVRDATGRAYNRTTHLDKRIEMMQAWSDYLYRLKDDYLKNN